MTDSWPVLIVQGGPLAGQCFTLRTDHASIGRSPDADIRLESDSVSRKHLSIRRQGSELFVQDLDSSNGTYVNNTKLAGTAILRPGDTVRLGDVELEYVLLGGPTESHSARQSQSYDFGDVHGPINTGQPINHEGNQIVGKGSIYHGPVQHGDRFEIDASDNGFQELFSGRGPGRAIMAIGLIMALVGFGIWMSVIFNAWSSGTSPFDMKILGLSAPITGFAMFGIGGLLLAIGSGMSKAARQRYERRH